MPARVAIVIPNWNGAGRLKSLLDQLAHQTLPADRIIVVDNGSTDESVAVAKSAGAEVLALGKNTGFSHAVNRGIESAQTEWIAVVNNDVAPEPGWLAALTAGATAANAWFAAGKLVNAAAPGQLDGTFDAVSRAACSWRCGHGRPDSTLWNKPRTIRFAPFTAALFHRELFDRIGLLDESFESYLEDVDFGLRCAAAQFSGIYVPEAVAHHTGSATLGRWHGHTVRRISRNQVLLIAKHYPQNWISRYGWPVLVGQVLWGFVALRHGAPLAYLKGKLEGMHQFRRARGNFPAAVPHILAESESEIRELQRLTGFDLYWRLYFALT